jgi:hypothetical protein
VLQNPTVQTADLNGNYLMNTIYQSTSTCKRGKRTTQQWRSRRITFDKTTQRYTQISKSLMYEDDAEATTTKGGMIRLFEFDVKSKTPHNTPIFRSYCMNQTLRVVLL